jgi:multiple RNA-binding domain-containing protein 1
LTYKQKKTAEMKKKSEETSNWNTLFLSSDTVMNAISAQLKVKKADLLDPESKSSLAVRVALAESTIIGETKKFLEENGVNLAAFEPKKTIEESTDPKLKDQKPKQSRSNTTIIVKNIPYDANEAELRKMFSPFGDLKRCMLPPVKSVALIEYLHPNHARKAFLSLAYKKFHHIPLYLEWAPKDTFEKLSGEDSTSERSVTKDSSQPPPPEDIPSTKLIIKNVPFETSATELRNLFETFGHIKRITLPKKFDGSHRGFAFVDYVTKQEAWNAMKSVGATHLYGRHLVLEWSKAEETEEESEERQREKVKRQYERLQSEEPPHKKKKSVNDFDSGSFDM